MRTPSAELKRLLIRYRRRGADEAFAVFSSAVWPLFYAWARSVLREHHLAEDAVQIALMRIARAVRRRKWRSRQGVMRWAKTIVQRVAIDLLRKLKRELFVLSQAKPCNGEASPHDTLVCKELEDRVREWLTVHATAKERRLFHLHFVKDLTYEVIGRRLKCSTATVCKGLQKAKEKLATFLGEGETQEQHLVEGEKNG